MLEAEPRNKTQELNQELVAEISIRSFAANKPERLDPLGANGFFRELAGFRRNGNAYLIREITEDYLAERAKKVTQDSKLEDIKAAQSDLAIAVTAATLINAGKDEIPNADEIVPKSALELVRLSKILDVSPRADDSNWTGSPRFFSDTLLTAYGRTVRAEAIIKVCVGKAWEKEPETFANLAGLTEVDVRSDEFKRRIRKATEDYEIIVSGMAVSRNFLLKSDVGMDFFKKEFLAFTAPIVINGQVEIHSGSKFHPNHLADKIFGITNDRNPEHVSYQAENIRSANSRHKEQFENVTEVIRQRGTITEQVLNLSDKAPALDIYEFLKVYLRFRNAHANGVKKTEDLRENGESSGLRLPMVYELQNRSVEIAKRLEEFLGQTA